MGPNETKKQTKKQKKKRLLEHRPDVFGSGFVIQVFCGESEEGKKTVSELTPTYQPLKVPRDVFVHVFFDHLKAQNP